MANELYTTISKHSVTITDSTLLKRFGTINHTKYAYISKIERIDRTIKSLADKCLKVVAQYFTANDQNRTIMTEDTELPSIISFHAFSYIVVYLNPNGSTPLDVLTGLSDDLVLKLITQHLSFFSLFDLYYSERYCGL